MHTHKHYKINNNSKFQNEKSKLESLILTISIYHQSKTQ